MKCVRARMFSPPWTVHRSSFTSVPDKGQGSSFPQRILCAAERLKQLQSYLLTQRLVRIAELVFH